MIYKSEKLCKRSACNIACVLDVIGDKWTLLVVRDLLTGKKTYNTLQDSPERISTNILADRLIRLVDNNIIVKTPYQNHPIRYEYVLTSKGNALGVIIKELGQWGEKYM